MTLDEITALVGTDKKVRVTGPSSHERPERKDWTVTGLVTGIKDPPPADAVWARSMVGMHGVCVDADDGRKMLLMVPDPLYEWVVLNP
jgi:hypothetical protein